MVEHNFVEIKVVPVVVSTFTFMAQTSGLHPRVLSRVMSSVFSQAYCRESVISE